MLDRSSYVCELHVMQVLVCSDAMTRGMDVENAANVVNYDAPVYAKVSDR